jgi:hypothetical protein
MPEQFNAISKMSSTGILNFFESSLASAKFLIIFICLKQNKLKHMFKRVLRHSVLELLRKLKRGAKKTKHFSGMGIVVYHSSYLPKIPCFSLRPTFKIDKKLIMKEDSTINFLLKISKKDSNLHDGFHFFNENGELTHISQYFVPPIRKIKPNKYHGVRYHAALLGSYLDGVIFTAVILKDGKTYLFSRGRILKV